MQNICRFMNEGGHFSLSFLKHFYCLQCIDNAPGGDNMYQSRYNRLCRKYWSCRGQRRQKVVYQIWYEWRYRGLHPQIHPEPSLWAVNKKCNRWVGGNKWRRCGYVVFNTEVGVGGTVSDHRIVKHLSEQEAGANQRAAHVGLSFEQYIFLNFK